MRASVLRSADYRRMRWKNRAGWTAELAVHPQPTSTDDAFDWRISIADIESDGAFSTFPDCERYIALLDGIGMELRFDSAPAVRLDRRLQFFRFAGDWQTQGILISGPVRDFNVIVRRALVRADVWHRPLVGPMVFLADAQVTWFVYLAGGSATLKNHADAPTLEGGDSLLLEGDDSGENLVLSGAGEVAIVKLTRVNPAAD